MTCYDLELGDQELAELVDRLADDAGAVAPALAGHDVRALIDLVLRTRLRRCSTCPREPDCGCVRPGHHLHDNARELANVCAINTADLLAPGKQRQALEEELARVLYARLALVVVAGQSCEAQAVRRPGPITQKLRDPQGR